MLFHAAGIVLGGAWGAMAGFRAMSGRAWRLRLNALLNGAGRNGAEVGNMLGSIAMMFSFAEGGLEFVDWDRIGVPGFNLGLITRNDMFIPAAAAFVAGTVYRSPYLFRPGALPSLRLRRLTD